jgi:pimeloyl-ACP methyl ester carboxylesterase
MKRTLTRPVSLLLALLLALSLSACGSTADGSSSDASSTEETTYELQMEISQADWDANRQYVELSTGITMSYVEMGVADGPVLILQHGMTDNSRVWSLSAPTFAAAGYHVYMPDLRGHGYSDQPNTGMYTVSDFAADLNAFMEAMGIESADVVGHSLGSMTMQAFMLLYPERCKSVTLVSSTPVTPDALGTYYYDYALGLGEDEHPDDEFMAAWYDNPNPVDEEFLSYVMKESQQLSALSWRAIAAGSAVEDLRSFYPFFDDSIPTLIMHGSLDGFFSDEMQQELLEYLPFATYQVYEGVGHNIQYEIPEQFAQDVLAFIAQ